LRLDSLCFWLPASATHFLLLSRFFYLRVAPFPELYVAVKSHLCPRSLPDGRIPRVFSLGFTTEADGRRFFHQFAIESAMREMLWETFAVDEKMWAAVEPPFLRGPDSPPFFNIIGEAVSIRVSAVVSVFLMFPLPKWRFPLPSLIPFVPSRVDLR